MIDGFSNCAIFYYTIKLLDLVGQCAQQVQSEDHRELAFVILYELTETVGDVLTAHFDVLQGLFLLALKDPR